MIPVTIHIGDQVHEIGLVAAPDPTLISMMVGEWAREFAVDEDDDEVPE